MQDPAEFRQRLGERVCQLRKKRGWSQERLAYDAGFARSFISAMERGKKDIRISTVFKLAHVFGISVSKLCKGSRFTLAHRRFHWTLISHIRNPSFMTRCTD